MRETIPFFGQIFGKNDITFLNEGAREAIVQTHNTLTSNRGGVVAGMEVSFSADKLSLIVNPGMFYSAGGYNSQNNQGGGERGDLLQQYSVRSLPETPPIATTPQYLLVYAKIITSNIDPNPSKSSQIVTSRNLQTGENVPTRQYSQVSIVVTNPGFASTLAAMEGVPLALIQVNYVGISRVASDGSIQSIDTSVRRNYIVGGSVDVNAGQLIDAGVPNNFLTTRMYQDNSISGPKFLDNSLTSVKLAQWDGTTSFNNLSGSGVANQHLKDNAVTGNKINHVSGVNNFGNRNYLLNSSFEILSGTSVLPLNWDATSSIANSISIVDFSSDPTAPKFGNKGLKMLGAFDGSNNALNLQVSQVIDFGEQLKDKPLSAFFWAKQFSASDFTKTGTTGLHGTIEFVDDSAVPITIGSPIIFGVISGVTTSNYLQFSTTAPVIFTGTATCSKIKYTIGGNFSGGYFVDGAMVVQSALIPGYDVSPTEYTNAFDIANGSITNVKLAVNAVATINLQDSSVTSAKILDGSITSSKILNGSITNALISANSIGSSNIQAGAVQTSSMANGSVTTSILDPTILAKMLPTAWALYDYNGTGLYNSFNINSIVQRNAEGDYTFTFLTPMSSNLYCVVLGGNPFGRNGQTYLNIWTSLTSDMTTTTVRIRSAPSSGPLGGGDPYIDRALSFVIFGGR